MKIFPLVSAIGIPKRLMRVLGAKMRILLISHYFEPSTGAAATRLSDLARRLVSYGHEVTVLTTMPHYPKGQIETAYRGKFSITEMRGGVRVIYTWLWATPSEKISRRLPSQLSFSGAAILRGLNLPKPDIVLIENQPMFTGFAGRLLADIKRVSYVLNISDLWPEHLLSVGAVTEKSLIYRLSRAMVDAGYRGAKKIISLSPAWTEKISTYLAGDRSKLETILRGTNTEIFKPLPQNEILAFQQKYSLDPAKKWISFLGTFATQYDFELSLSVVQAFANRDDIGFVYIGTGSQREVLQAEIAKANFANLRLIDWISHDEMPLAWNASYLNYWAMRDETLYQGTVPAKLFEALATGTAIAAAQKGVAAKIIAEAGTGLTVLPNDKAALIAAIERLLNDETFRQECKINARNYAEAHFSFEQVARRYESILLAALQK